ncbi:ankyrin repeat domain-containing protein [Flavihumibacter sp. RY-1]|uniref:Ankyrin repeat domain-containing protein n=1 Tax=Flavihumibacter fluminis TaxID=2909236 RepID=A0ABS9BER3_9BACT|nr:ankyrin repeat domain-containing protein [Flavihumibacter fluminis]MCF1713558.1 ankyrin repeat domain-containing protein [Flavihumibacter fluminis]
MKKTVLFCLLLAPILGLAQNNTLLRADFWKTNPDLAAVKAEIAKGNKPSEANGGNFDVVTMAINNNATTEIIKYLVSQDGNGVGKKTHDGRIYLHWAASRGNIEVVKYLLEKGADINFGDDRGTIPLVYALANGQTNTAVYEVLFKAGNNPKQKFQNGASLLLLGIANDKELVLSEYLVTKGLSYTDTDDLGRTAFDYAARSGNLELLKKLKAKGVKHSNQALLFAAQGGRGGAAKQEVYQYLVEELKIPATAVGENDETILPYLVRRPNQQETIQYFLNKGVDINKADKKGETALTHAVQFSTAEMVGWLLDKGASVVVNSKEGNLGYYLLQSYRSPRAGETPIDFTNKLNLLIAKGVNLNTAQPDGNTLYHLAVAKNDIQLFQLLAPLKIDINAKNKDGMTALHRAALVAKDDQLLKYLVSIGAKKELLTELDETAYDLAKENGFLKEKKVGLDFLK